jgi:glyoxylase-like metal-dependent hydrolase (beta-lactamase superfamily II)
LPAKTICRLEHTNALCCRPRFYIVSYDGTEFVADFAQGFVGACSLSFLVKTADEKLLLRKLKSSDGRIEPLLRASGRGLAVTWQIGDVRITRIVEQEFAMPASALLAEFEASKLADYSRWLIPHFMQSDGQFIIAIQAFLIESGGKSIIVDTCVGNDRPFPGSISALQTHFLTDLEKIASRRSIDYVLCTHLHFDHVGWNTMLVEDFWVPTFPNARYLFNRKEYEHWNTGAEDDYVDFQYAVEPIVRAGLHEFIEPGHRITDDVYVESTPGHTPGHVSVVIRSKGEEAIITGDIIHSPVQFAEPTWSSASDVLPRLAIETRLRVIERLKNKPILVIGTHFPNPTAGHIVGDSLSCRLETQSLDV